LREPRHPSTQDLNQYAGVMLAPIVRILAAVGLSAADISKACEQEYRNVRSRLPKTRLIAIDGDPRYPEMITRWVTHPRYQCNGKPAHLKCNGRSPSFAALVREMAPSRTARAVLDDWRQLKLVRVRPDGRVMLLRRFVRTRSGREFDLRHVARTMGDFLHSLELNILESTRPGKGLFQRHAVSYDVSARLAPNFNVFARNQAMQLLECIDDWLARHRMPRSARRRKQFRLGLGIYVVDESIRSGSH
jgi:hypothetical protein